VAVSAARWQLVDRRALPPDSAAAGHAMAEKYSPESAVDSLSKQSTHSTFSNDQH